MLDYSVMVETVYKCMIYLKTKTYTWNFLSSLPGWTLQFPTFNDELTYGALKTFTHPAQVMMIHVLYWSAVYNFFLVYFDTRWPIFHILNNYLEKIFWALPMQYFEMYFCCPIELFNILIYCWTCLNIRKLKISVSCNEYREWTKTF